MAYYTFSLDKNDLKTIVAWRGHHTPQYAEEVLLDKPMGYWRLGDPSGLPQDYSGRGHHATSIQGGAITQYDATGLIIQDDGAVSVTNSSIVVDDHADFDSGDIITTEGWCRLDTTTGGQYTLMSKNGATNEWLIEAFVSGATPRYKIRMEHNLLGFVETASFLEPFRTYHWAITKNGTDRHFYIDGVDVTVLLTNRTIIDNEGHFTMAGWGLGVGAPWVGVLDEMAIYNYALPATRIQQHYDAGKVLRWVDCDTIKVTDNDIKSMWTYEVGNIVHIATQEGTTGRVAYHTFNKTTGQFETRDELVKLPGTAPSASKIGCCIAVANNGRIVIGYTSNNGTTDKANYSHKISGAWTENTAVFGLGNGEAAGALVYTGSNVDAFQYFCTYGTGATFTMMSAHISNTGFSAGATSASQTSEAEHPFGKPVWNINGSNDVIFVPTSRFVNASFPIRADAIKTNNDTSSVIMGSNPIGAATNATSGAVKEVGTSTASNAVAVDDAKNVYFLLGENSDSDIYKSVMAFPRTGLGDATKFAEFKATNISHINANWYTRNNGRKVAYVWENAGDSSYNYNEIDSYLWDIRNEPVGIYENNVRASKLFRPVADIVAIIENAIGRKSIKTINAEIVAIVETNISVKRILAFLSELIVILESPTGKKHIRNILNEIEGIYDITTTRMSLFRRLSDIVAIIENSVGRKSIKTINAELVAIIESARSVKRLIAKLSELIIILESPTGKKHIRNILNEIEGIYDITTVRMSLFRRLSDVVAIIENSIGRKKIKTINAELVAIIDSTKAFKLILNILNEIVGIYDVQNRLLTMFRRIADIVSINESSLLRKSIKTINAELVTIIESGFARRRMNAIINEVGGIYEIIVRLNSGVGEIIQQLREVVGIFENNVKAARYTAIVRDVVAIIENSFGKKAIRTITGEIVGIYDTTTRVTTLLRRIAEVVKIIENSVGQKFILAITGEIIGIYDTTSRFLRMFRRIGEVVTIIENSFGRKAIRSITGEIVGIYDTTSRLLTMFRRISDLVSINENSLGRKAIRAVINEVEGIYEVIQRVLTAFAQNFIKIINEVEGIYESVKRTSFDLIMVIREIESIIEFRQVAMIPFILRNLAINIIRPASYLLSRRYITLDIKRIAKMIGFRR